MDCVDLFAGAGGFSEGAKQAGLRVVCAANHWQVAVDAHAANHPLARHITQDLSQADFTTFPKHDVLLASPACQGHTKARGIDRPHHDACRSTAWAVIACAEVHQPRFVVVENVPEFLNWKLYPAWKRALELMGYSITENILDAADFGVPQHRIRAFIIGTRGKSIMLNSPRLRHVSAAEIVSMNDGRWSRIEKPRRAISTLVQVMGGRKRYGNRFLIAYYGSERQGRSLDSPLGTVTTHDRFGIINGDHMRMLSIDEYRAAMGFAVNYKLPENHKTALHLLGNAVPPPMAKGVLEQLKWSA